MKEKDISDVKKFPSESTGHVMKKSAKSGNQKDSSDGEFEFKVGSLRCSIVICRHIACCIAHYFVVY